MDVNKLTDKEMEVFIKLAKEQHKKVKNNMKVSLDYYEYKHDILNKRRVRIGKNGSLEEVKNLPNSRQIDNQFAKAVDNKVNYLLSLPPVIKCKKDEGYQQALQDFFDRRKVRTLNKIGLEAVICGIAWAYVYPDKNGELKYKKVDTLQVTPWWSDKEHETLNALIYDYIEVELVEDKLKEIEYTEVHTDNGFIRYKKGDKDKLTKVYEGPHLTQVTNKGQKGLIWEKIPFVYFKSNKQEMPLINRCKSIQDAINLILSNFEDNMVEDGRSTIFVITNYDGENLGEFRSNLNTFAAVGVESTPEVEGKVDTITVEVNSENYRVILDMLKEKLIENVRSVDTQNVKNTQARNQLDIKNMYMDMELDANEMEMEFQGSINHLEWFFKKMNRIDPNSYKTEANITFKRNMTIADDSIVDMIYKTAGTGIVSDETLRSKHPLVDDLEEETQRVEEERNQRDQGAMELAMQQRALTGMLGEDDGE